MKDILEKIILDKKIYNDWTLPEPIEFIHVKGDNTLISASILSLDYRFRNVAKKVFLCQEKKCKQFMFCPYCNEKFIEKRSLRIRVPIIKVCFFTGMEIEDIRNYIVKTFDKNSHWSVRNDFEEKGKVMLYFARGRQIEVKLPRKFRNGFCYWFLNDKLSEKIILKLIYHRVLVEWLLLLQDEVDLSLNIFKC